MAINFILFMLLIINDVKSNDKKESLDEKFRQKHAKVVYVNPQYLSNVSVFTHRISRRSPYLTSFNATLLTSWDNNYVIEVEAFNKELKLEIMRLASKVCDTLSQQWVVQYLKQINCNIPTVCPVPQGAYYIIRTEMPPKGFPLPKFLPKGLYDCRLNGYHIINNARKNTMFKVVIEFEFKGL